MDLLQNPTGLTKHITCVLHEKNNCGHIFPKGVSGSATTSAVLFLLGFHPKQDGVPPEPCLILNKRSARVKQPGDLCFPGGRIAPRLDFFIGRLLSLPLFSLGRWAYWSEWCDVRRPEARRLALLFAASIRESFEEMRLNPLWLKFLGPMASHNLVMFPRVIYPMVGWITRQKRFLPNWEVEKIVRISLRDLLTPEHYRCYRLDFGTLRTNGQTGATQDLPCFLHRNEGEEEILWGATFAIVFNFLHLAMDLSFDLMHSQRRIERDLPAEYFTGKPRE